MEQPEAEYAETSSKFENSKSVKILPKDEGTKKTLSRNEELIPPDGGYGWLVLAGSMLVNLLVPGTVKSFGVLFMEFLEAFEASPSSALWIPALCYFLYSSLGPLSSILSVKYSYRTVTLIGGTFAALGMIISCFASSVGYLYISYGFLVGTGAGLSFPPTVYIVTSYFVRLRGLANGICISGSAFGSIILPPILRYLLEEYGYRGAILIMGGLTLNTWVAALFYEPVENHMKRVPKGTFNDIIDEEDEDIVRETYNDIIDEGGITFCTTEGGITLEQTDHKTVNSNTKTNNTIRNQCSDEETSPLQNLRKNDKFIRSVSAVAVQSFKNVNEDRQRKISTPVRGNHSFINTLSSTSSLYTVPESRFSHSSRLNRLNQCRSGGQQRPPKRSPSTSSFHFVSTPYHGSTLSFPLPEEFASHMSLKSIASSINPMTVCSKQVSKNKFLDLSLIKDPVYLVILISNSTNAIGYTNFIILLPTFATTLGFDKNLAAYLLSIVSVFDLVGRIGGSALSDWTTFVPKAWYFVGGLALSGFSLAVLPFARTYSMVSFWCGLFGLASGTYVGITAVIMADMLGTERLTSTYGISLFVNGILQLIGPPICGLWYESIPALFSILGLVLLAGASLWGFMPFIQRNRNRKTAGKTARV